MVAAGLLGALKLRPTLREPWRAKEINHPVRGKSAAKAPEDLVKRRFIAPNGCRRVDGALKPRPAAAPC